MTTATDWDVTDTETGEHPVVTDVTSAAPLDGPIYTAEDAQRLAMQNARLTDQMRRLDAENVRLSAACEQARTALEALRSELHPLDERRTGWTPRPSTMPAKHWTDVHGVDDLTEQQQRAALIAPTLAEVRDGEDYLGAKVAAELMAGADSKPGWPTWLGELHHADATLTAQVAGMRSWADNYTARPVERTVVEPVQVDTSYRESEAWALADMVLAGRDRETGGVLASGPYSELAPERIQADVPPDDRAQRMTDEPGRYFSEARERAERRIADRTGLDKLAQRVPTALTTGETERDRTEPSQSEPEPWWRRNSEWLYSGAIGLCLFGAIGIALVVLA